MFPFLNLQAAYHTARSLLVLIRGPTNDDIIGFSDVPLTRLRTARIDPIGASRYRENLLFTGGWISFREFCPENGCAAVELSRDGHLVHAYPNRPEELLAKTIETLPHEAWPVSSAPQNNFMVIGVAKLGAGDLIVVYDAFHDFPYGDGMARLDPNGHVRWNLHTYINHWPAVAGNLILATSSVVRSGPVTFALSGGSTYTLRCNTKLLDDVVEVVDLNGKVLERISVLQALLDSPYRALLFNDQGDDAHACDPLHLNHATLLGAELARSLEGTSPDDLLVSMRNISAFAIIGRKNHRMKYLFHGSFRYQHAVQPFSGSKVVMFDDLGQNAGDAPSRILLYDLRTHAEQVLFSAARAPDRNMFTLIEGTVSVSADKTRLFVTAADSGEGYEIEIPSGHVATVVHNLQDVHMLAEFGDEKNTRALRLRTHGIYYSE